MIIFCDERPRPWLQHIDPRLRIAVTCAWALLACRLDRLATLGSALAISLLLFLLARLPGRLVLRRLAHLGFFAAVLLVFLPVSVPGRALLEIGPFAWSESGMTSALAIAARASSILLVCAALLGSMEPAHFGLALQDLGCPSRLAQAFLFMVRYTETIHQEYHRLRDAMRLRCFRAGCDLATLRALGFLVGMLFVRSAERAERVLEAMKCRGFRGRFCALERFRFAAADAAFGIVAATAIILLGSAP